LCCRPGTAVKLLWPAVNPALARERIGDLALLANIAIPKPSTGRAPAGTTSSWRPGAGLQQPNATPYAVREATSQLLPRGRGRRCTDESASRINEKASLAGPRTALAQQPGGVQHVTRRRRRSSLRRLLVLGGAAHRLATTVRQRHVHLHHRHGLVDGAEPLRGEGGVLAHAPVVARCHTPPRPNSR
jgi:hypothetical protein